MRLIDVRLLEMDAAGGLRMHRLLAAFVRAVLGDATAQAVVETTILRVAEEMNERRNPRPLLVVQPHLRFITETAQPRGDVSAAGLANALGEHLRQLGVYAEAQRVYEQALVIQQQVLGHDHPDTARSLNNLGELLRDQGQYAEAQRVHEQALAIRQRVLGHDHPDTARSLNNLGIVLHDQGQYTQAQRAHEQALAIRQQMLGPDHPDTARSLNNLGELLRDQGQYAQAQRAYEQALAIRQQMLGPDHPDTARSLCGLGEVLHVQGDVAQARRYLEHAGAILAKLPHASTIQQAAAACVMSERTLKRKLMTARMALGIPANGLTRHRPSELAELLWTALGREAVAADRVSLGAPGSIDHGYGESSQLVVRVSSRA